MHRLLSIVSAFLLVLLMVPCSFHSASAQGPKNVAKKELEKLQGSWKVLKFVKEGEAKTDEDLRKTQVVIAGDKLTIKTAVKDEVTRITIAPEKKPATIDLHVEGKKITLLGIYELDKDMLKICFGLEETARPTEFASTEKSKTSLMILERAKK